MSNSPNYSPEFKGPIEGYVVNTLKAHRWRIEASMTHDDAMQEAFFVFMRVAEKYPGVDAPNFMALFKRSWHNALNDLATADTRHRAMLPLHGLKRGSDGGELPEFEAIGETDNNGYLSVLIKQAPREVQAVLNLFLNAPQEILDVALRGWGGKGQSRSKGNDSKAICKLLGLPPDLDVLTMVEEHFEP